MEYALCADCGWRGLSIAKHLARSPMCDANKEPRPTPSPLEAASVITEALEKKSKEMRALVASNIAKQILVHNASYTAVNASIKETRQAMILAADMLSCEIGQKLGVATEEVASYVKPAIKDRADIYKGLDTTKRQLAYLKSELPYVAPKSVHLGSRNVTYEEPDGDETNFKEAEAYAEHLSVVDQIINIMEASPKAAKAILAQSDLLKSGMKNRPVPTTIASPLDGTNIRAHPFLQEPILDDPRVVVTQINLSADEVDTTNPCGIARGLYKLFGMEFSLVALPVEMRHDPKFIGLAALAYHTCAACRLRRRCAHRRCRAADHANPLAASALAVAGLVVAAAIAIAIAVAVAVAALPAAAVAARSPTAPPSIILACPRSTRAVQGYQGVHRRVRHRRRQRAHAGAAGGRRRVDAGRALHVWCADARGARAAQGAHRPQRRGAGARSAPAPPRQPRASPMPAPCQPRPCKPRTSPVPARLRPSPPLLVSRLSQSPGRSRTLAQWAEP